jgi:hypothetical protein
VTTPNTAATATEQGAEELTPEQAKAAWLDEAEKRTNPEAAAAAAVTPPAEEPEAEPVTDEVQIPEELKSALSQVNDLKTLVQNLQHQVRSSDGRVGALQRELSQSKAAAQITSAPAPNQQALARAAKSPEKWEALKKEFPEWGEAVEELVSANLSQQPAAPQVDLTPLQTQLNEAIAGVEAKFGRAIEEAKVYGAHPKWKDTVKTQEFGAWFGQQPAELQALAASQNGEDAIAMLDRYGDHLQKQRDASRNVPQERQARLAAAVQPARKGTAPPPQSDADMTPAQLWASEAASRERARAARTR